MQLLDWPDAFAKVCGRDRHTQDALRWGLPEPWVQTELYAELEQRASDTGWHPFANEVPYVTRYPVRLPKKTYRDWRTEGAVKWIDLCLHSISCDTWCWLELKVRQVGDLGRSEESSYGAREVFCRDVVALMGFDAKKTGDTWEYPDDYTEAYWFKEVLGPYTGSVRSRRHHFVAAFLQLGGGFAPTVWEDRELEQQIARWFGYRERQAKTGRACPEIRVRKVEPPITGAHSLLICDWDLPPGT
jgi:hypothetical protein